MDRDGMVHGTNGTWDQFISRETLGTFGSRGVDLHIGVNRQSSQQRHNRRRYEREFLSSTHLEAE